MKTFLLLILILASFSLFAGEIKVMEVGSKDLFSYERIEPEFIFDQAALTAGVNVKLSSSYLSEYLPRDNQVNLKEMRFDRETGNILLSIKNKVILCGYVKKKKNGFFSKNVGMTGACKFDQRYEEKSTQVNDIITRVQVLEIYLTF